MLPIRIFFIKQGPSKYMSHLDLTRLMTRVVRRTDIPIWYTEGFNPHPFMTFALPLSLGTMGLYETMDIKLTDESYPLERVTSSLNACLPEGIEVTRTALPRMKPTEIDSASYEIALAAQRDKAELLCREFEAFCASDSIMSEKKTKHKKIVSLDLKPHIRECVCEANDNGALIKLRLSAGCTDNLNPSVVLKAFSDKSGIDLFGCLISRTGVYAADMRLFE